MRSPGEGMKIRLVKPKRFECAPETGAPARWDSVSGPRRVGSRGTHADGMIAGGMEHEPRPGEASTRPGDRAKPRYGQQTDVS